jgi:hypothetical protein
MLIAYKIILMGKEMGNDSKVDNIEIHAEAVETAVKI